MQKTCNLFFSLSYPKFESDTECFSLVDEKEYAMLSGRFSSSKTSFEKHKYRNFVKEYHEPRSTANFVVNATTGTWSALCPEWTTTAIS